MNRSVWSRIGVSAAVSVLMTAGYSGAAVADTDSDVVGDPLSLKIANALKPDRFFMRAGVILVKVKTKSGDTYDVTGPVVTRSELAALFDPADPVKNAAARNALTANENFTPAQKTAARNAAAAALRGAQGIPLLIGEMDRLEIDSLGTPDGIQAEAAGNMGTAGISIGYFLDDARNWVLETYVLAAPLSTSAKGKTGSTTREDLDNPGEYITRPLQINGQKIVTTKLLPPTVLFGRYWGDKESKFRPYTGIMATYAIFFNSKATDFLNTYVGGGNPGDTSVSMKNAFGAGPVVGFNYQINDKWHASINVGTVKLKTQATITTRNSTFSDATPALQDLGTISDTLAVAQQTYGPTGTGGSEVGRATIALNGGVTATVMKALAAVKGQENQGTFVRKTDVKLTNTLFFLSVGRSF